MSKENVVYSYNGVVFSHTKHAVLSFVAILVELETTYIVNTYIVK